jgi:hypothetical protein
LAAEFLGRASPERLICVLIMTSGSSSITEFVASIKRFSFSELYYTSVNMFALIKSLTSGPIPDPAQDGRSYDRSAQLKSNAILM